MHAAQHRVTADDCIGHMRMLLQLRGDEATSAISSSDQSIGSDR